MQDFISNMRVSWELILAKKIFKSYPELSKKNKQLVWMQIWKINLDI